jgi:heat shock protein 5
MERKELINIGIDLGTTNTAYAIRENAPLRSGYSVREFEDGEIILPSVVSFSTSADKTDVIIGKAALNQQFKNPKCTIYGSKRLIGKKYNEPEVKSLFRNAAFTITKRQKAAKGQRIADDGQDLATICIENQNGKQYFAPEQISGFILGEVASSVEKKNGRKPDNVVITVPAYFNDLQRSATIQAAKFAKLNVIGLANEPTAAAVAFQQKCGLTKAKVLVFDFGGGTLDCSIIEVDGNKFRVLAVSGDTDLGGEDIDAALVKYMIEKFRKKYSYGGDIDARAMTLLKRECEEAKKRLTSTLVADIYLPGWVDGKDLKEKIPRYEFEMQCDEIFDRILEPIERVVDDSGIEPDEITNIIMVGGSSRIPRVVEMVKEFFDNKIEPLTAVNPDEAIAIGAAIICDSKVNNMEGIIDDSSSIKYSKVEIGYIELVNVQPYSIGILSGRNKFKKFIERNKPLPQEKSFKFTTMEDYKTTATIQIIQGEDEDAVVNLKDSKEFLLIKKFDLVGIPSRPRGDVTIDIKLKIDESGILYVNATCLDNSVTSAIDIKIANVLTDADIKEASTFQNALMEKKRNKSLCEEIEYYLRKYSGQERIRDINKFYSLIVPTIPTITDDDLDKIEIKFDEIKPKVDLLHDINQKILQRVNELKEICGEEE